MAVTGARLFSRMVSPFISPDEKQVMQVLLREQRPFILLTDNGFRDYYKPTDTLFMCFVLLIFMFPFGIHGEPSLPYAVMLLVQFQDAPETGEGYDAEDDARVFIRDEQRGNEGSNAGHEEGWPALLAEVVFALDDQRMEDSDGQKRGETDDESDVVHNR